MPYGGWVIGKENMRAQLGMKSPALFTAWHVLLKYLAPIAILAITVFGLAG